MLGDKAYDSNELREELDQRGTKPVIRNPPVRAALPKSAGLCDCLLIYLQVNGHI